MHTFFVGYHGLNGPVTVEKSNYEAEMKKPILEAAQELGYEVIDVNGARQTGENATYVSSTLNCEE